MKVVCFDLDDTLYKEIDYLHAAYTLIAQSVCREDWRKCYSLLLEWYEAGENVFEKICMQYPSVAMDRLLHIYRYDVHQLYLSPEVEKVISSLKTAGYRLGIITDGRVLTQRNKFEALGLNKFFSEDMVVISEQFGSEKPSENNYRYFMDKFPECSSFTYVGDNPQKDFVGANRLGWNTVCLMEDGRNIHKQNFELAEEYLPKVMIDSLSELITLFR